jgi:acyl-CoA synthetase (AMP-forming)/AMP-acid ligase II
MLPHIKQCRRKLLTSHLRNRLVDENDNDVEEGQSGEALLKGPMVTKGYHNNPDANNAAFTTDGWFRTGDVLKMEGDVFYLVDRKKVRPGWILTTVRSILGTEHITGIDKVQGTPGCAS